MIGFVLLMLGVTASMVCLVGGYGPVWLTAWIGMSLSFALGAGWAAKDRIDFDPLGPKDTGKLG